MEYGTQSLIDFVEGDVDEYSVVELPSQLADRQQANDSGEHRLLGELFRGALADLDHYGRRKYPSHHPNYYRLLYERAREWIAGAEAALPFYFVMDHLGYDVEEMRSVLLLRYPELPAIVRGLSREERRVQRAKDNGGVYCKRERKSNLREKSTSW